MTELPRVGSRTWFACTALCIPGRLSERLRDQELTFESSHPHHSLLTSVDALRLAYRCSIRRFLWPVILATSKSLS